jgi:hypothetical protein
MRDFAQVDGQAKAKELSGGGDIAAQEIRGPVAEFRTSGLRQSEFIDPGG